ncbi:NlpC/P60 family protein [Pelagibacteraceae bacterium]|nr:NlpC/P60 family protein [Pelagibacteraceae bacterium]
MSKLYSNIKPEINIYKKMSTKSSLVTQMIFGESFKILKKNSTWLKIKVKEDNYIGYIKNKYYISYFKPTHKVSALYANLYKNSSPKIKIGKLTFGSKIKITEKNNKFSKFENKWIKNKNIKSMKFINKNIFSSIKLFKNVKYKWGGKSYKGLDCSALIQVFINFNNQFCPRDTKDQVRYFKKNISLKDIKKDDIIYWRGHVAVALSKKKLIHAYGPMKKTIIMDIKKTIKLIRETANLKVIFIKRI